MILNYIWIGLILLSVLFGIVNTLISGDVTILNGVFQSTFDSVKNGFEISLGLTGVLSFWMGIMKIGEKGGVVAQVSRWVQPFFSELFPELGGNHPAFGKMVMNISATMLGIDNAATGFGLEAMQELQKSNQKKEEASNAMIMFLVLVTSGLTLVPVSIFTYRAQLHAANPTDVFLPILISTYCAAMGGVILTAIIQKINLFKKNILLFFGILTAIMVLFVLIGLRLDEATLNIVSITISSVFLLGVIVWFILAGTFKHINVYDAFIEGAKDGFYVAVGIIPYLIAILVAVGMFRASGGLDFVINGLSAFFALLGINTDFVPSLPTAFMRPLSGSGARGMMMDAMLEYGVDSFVGRLVSVIQGSTDTTFYILAVYFGRVGIKNTRYAVVCGLFADFCGILAAIIVSYIFFH